MYTVDQIAAKMGLPSSKIEKSDLRVDLERLLSTLTQQQIKAVLLFAKGYNQQEIAIIMGISQQAVSKMFRKTAARMKGKL